VAPTAALSGLWPNDHTRMESCVHGLVRPRFRPHWVPP
jgi:hypothetical protein